MYLPKTVIAISAREIPKQDVVIGTPLSGYMEVVVEYQVKGSIFPQAYIDTFKWYPEEKELRDAIRLPTRVGRYQYQSHYPPLWEMVEVWDFVVAMHENHIIPEDYFQWFKGVVKEETQQEEGE